MYSQTEPPTRLPAVEIERIPPRQRPLRTPHPLGEPGLFIVDASWGSLQPHVLAPGVRTVGELEVIEHLRRGGRLVDTRSPAAYVEATIPTALNIPYPQALERIDELDPFEPAVFFCNGPQCAATPAAVATLLGDHFPEAAILYYRGGMHDWVTLGLPVEPGRG